MVAFLIVYIYDIYKKFRMGQTLSRLEWTLNVLATTSNNEKVLSEITESIDHLCEHYPSETQILFKKPLIWNTRNLKPILFTSNASFTVSNQK